jgi:H+/Cl- antiporter ClcA
MPDHEADARDGPGSSSHDGHAVSASPAPPEPSLTQTRDFWVLMAYALGLGIFGAFVSLAFLALIGWGNNWWSDSDVGWGGGEWWWAAVTAGFGLVVGLLHWATRLPERTPGLIEDIDDEHVDPRLVPGIVAVSLASLIGGASLGPEKPLGAMGGGLGGWLSQRWHRDEDDSRVTTLSGFGGAYGGMLSSPVVVVALILEIARPVGRQGAKALPATVVASSVSFVIYFAVGGAFFLDVYKVPQYEFRSWQLLAAVAFGLLAAVLTVVLVLLVKVVGVLFSRLKMPSIAKSTLGGLIFGLVGVALPLTMFTGSDQLKTVLHDQGTTLGLGILIALVVAKMFTFAVSLGSGFVGGPIFASLFMGGTAGVAVHVAIPGVPLGLAFSCMVVSIVAALVSAPFTAVLFAVFTTQVGALQSAPILITAITAYLAMEAAKYALVSRNHAKEQAQGGRPRAGDEPPAAAVDPSGGGS